MISFKPTTLILASALACQLTYGADQLLNLPLPSDGTRYDTNAEMAPIWPSSHGEGNIAFWGDDKLAAVSITIDDNNANDHAFWMQQGNEHGWKFTWFVIVHPYMWNIYTDQPGSNTSYFGTAQDFKTLYDAGHEIGLHGACSATNSLSAVDYRTHMELSIDHLEGVIGNDIKTYAYPCGDTGANGVYRDEAAQLFIGARGTTGGPTRMAVADYLNTNSMASGSNQSWWDKLEQQPSNVNYSGYRGWAVLLWHNLADAAAEQAAADRLDWIKSKKNKYWVKPFGYVARYAQERESGTITMQSVSATEIRFSLSDRMDDSIFDVPLTVKFRTDGWSTVQATQSGVSIPAKIVTHQGAQYTFVDAIPDKGQVRIWTAGGSGGGNDVGTLISATLFDAESNPGDDTEIRISGDHIGWIKEGNWIRFDNFDFGSGADYCTVEASSGGAGGRIEFRLGSPTGTMIGSIDVTSNGSWNDYRTFSTNSITNEANADLYLVFKRINTSTADLMNLKSIKFEANSDVGSTISATLFDAESHPGDDTRIRISGANIGWIKEGNWIRFNDFNFGSGASSCTVEASSGGAGGRIEFRLGSATGTLIGSIDVTSNGMWNDYRTITTNSITNEANADLYLVFERINTSTQDLMNLKTFKFE